VEDATTAALVSTLNAQRQHVTGILDGLDPDALRRPVLPSRWTCLGLVQHLTLDVEEFWFQVVMTGERPLANSESSAWTIAPDTDPEAVLGRYREAIERANGIAAATPLEAAPVAWPGDLFGDFRLPDLRAILLHVITETACHAGHLDAGRELLDERQWLVLDAGRT